MNENVKEVEKNVNEQQLGQLITVDLTYNILTDFNEKLSSDFVEWCLDIENFNTLYMEQNKCTKDDLPVLTINISSPGGIVSEMYRMLSALSILSNTIIVRGIGMCASCGLFFYLACSDIRLSTPYTEFLYHNISYSVGQTNLESHRQTLKDSDKIQKKLDEMIMKKTNITKQQLSKHKNDDWIIDNDLALKLGVVTYSKGLDDLFDELDDESHEEVKED